MDTQKKWTLQPQECTGDYKFEKRPYMTTRVNEELPEDEVMQIIQDVKGFVEKNGNADYLQVFQNEIGRMIFCIDDRSHWTILFSNEY